MKYLRIQLCDLPLAKIFDPCTQQSKAIAPDARSQASRAQCDRASVYGGGSLVTKCNSTDLNHIPYE